MANTIRVAVEIKDLYGDLKAAGDGLERNLEAELLKGAQRIATAAKPLMRYRGTGSWRGSSGARLPHIRDTYTARIGRGASANVGSDHPAAPVFEFGGQIAPRVPGGSTVARAVKPSALITIPKVEPVARAGELLAPQIEQSVADSIDALLAKHHL